MNLDEKNTNISDLGQSNIEMQTLKNENENLNKELTEIRDFILSNYKFNMKMSTKDAVIKYIGLLKQKYKKISGFNDKKNQIISENKQILIKSENLVGNDTKLTSTQMLNKVLDLKEEKINFFSSKLHEFDSLTSKMRSLLDKESNHATAVQALTPDGMFDIILSLKTTRIQLLENEYKKLENLYSSPPSGDHYSYSKRSENTVASLKRKISVKDSKIQSLKELLNQAVIDHRTEITRMEDQMEQKVIDHQTEITRMEDQLNQKVIDHQTEISGIEDQLKQVVNFNAEVKKEYKLLSKKLANQRKCIQALEKLKQNFNILEEERNTVIQNLEEQKQKCTALEEEKAKLEEKCKILEGEKSRSIQELVEQKQNYQKLKEENKKLQDENESFQEKSNMPTNNSIQQTDDKDPKEKEKLEVHLFDPIEKAELDQQPSDQISSLKNELSKKNELITNLQNEIEELTKKCEINEGERKSTDDLLRKHVLFVRTENDKQIKRLKFLQQMEIKAILENQNIDNQDFEEEKAKIEEKCKDLEREKNMCIQKLKDFEEEKAKFQKKIKIIQDEAVNEISVGG